VVADWRIGYALYSPNVVGGTADGFFSEGWRPSLEGIRRSAGGREIVLAVVFTACANSFVEVGAFHAERPLYLVTP
jgi:hypothetical protein